MRRIVALAMLMCAGVVISAQTKPAAVAKPLIPFQGTWVLTTPDGRPLAQSGDLIITITGDKYAQSVGGTVNERGTMKIDAAKSPMWIDLTIAEGSDAGKTQVGLIEVKGDVMTGVFSFPGNTTRPTSLEPQDGVIAFVGKKKAK